MSGAQSPPCCRLSLHLCLGGFATVAWDHVEGHMEYAPILICVCVGGLRPDTPGNALGPHPPPCSGVSPGSSQDPNYKHLSHQACVQVCIDQGAPVLSPPPLCLTPVYRDWQWRQDPGAWGCLCHSCGSHRPVLPGIPSRSQKTGDQATGAGVGNAGIPPSGW